VKAGSRDNFPEDFVSVANIRASRPVQAGTKKAAGGCGLFQNLF